MKIKLLVPLLLSSCINNNTTSSSVTLPEDHSYSCRDNPLGGITRIYSDDSIELGLVTNQVWILARAEKKEGYSKDYELFFLKPTDLGRGGMTIPWNSISNNKPIATLSIISDEKIEKKFIGLYDSVENEYIEFSYDWNLCDTLYSTK